MALACIPHEQFEHGRPAIGLSRVGPAWLVTLGYGRQLHQPSDGPAGRRRPETATKRDHNGRDNVQVLVDIAGATNVMNNDYRQNGVDWSDIR